MNLPTAFPGKLGVAIMDCDGWLVGHPTVSPFFMFMNRKWVEKRMINLGEI